MPGLGPLDTFAQKLGFHGLAACATSVATAGAAAAGAPHPNAESLAIAAALGGVAWLGSYFTNRAASSADRREAERIPAAKVLRLNHSLTGAVALGIQRTIEAALEDAALAKYPRSRDILSRLKDESEPFYRHIVTADANVKDSSAQAMANLAQAGALASTFDLPGESAEASVLLPTPEEWGEFLRGLFRAAVPDWQTVFDELRPAFVALHGPLTLFISCHFAEIFRELMKTAKAYPGSDLAKAHAAIELHVWAQLLAFLRQSRAPGVGEKRIIDEIGNCLRRMDERTLERHRDLLRITERLVPEIAQIGEDVAFLADSAKSGLISLDEFSERYWRRQSFDPGMKQLLGDEARGRLLRESFPNREEELAHFQEFLGGDQEVLYYFADPGAGKSRMMLELAGIAKQAGWRSEFIVSEDLKDKNLVTAWQGLRDPGAHYLLIWDDYRPGNKENLRQFLKLHELVGGDRRPRMKRLLTSWRVFRSEIEEGGRPWWLESRALPLIDEKSASWASLIEGLSRGYRYAGRLRGLAGGNPQISMFAVNLVLNGKDPGEFSGYDSICDASYRPFIAMIDSADREAFRALCANGQIEVIRAGMWAASLGRLWKAAFIERHEGVYHAFSDVLRMFVCKQSLLEDGNPLALESEDPAAEWASCAKDLFPGAFPEVWSITAVALAGDESASKRVKARLLEIAREMAAAPDGSMGWATALFSATIAEPSASVRGEIAGEIGRIAERHDPPVAAIDERWASALSNATVEEPSASVCREIAGEIGRIAQRHDTPVAAIDERWASALSNATAKEPSASVCREIAGEIGRIAQRHDTPVAAIDERWAKALYNATVEEPSASVRREIAGEIGRIAERHHAPVAAIDEQWAKALFNATVTESSASVRREIAGEIGRIAERHHAPVATIDERWAKALYNATVEEPSASVRREIAGEIGRIAERHHAPVAAIDEAWAKALYNATVEEPSASVRREIAGEIGRIAQRHDTPVAAIDERWASALFNATVTEPSASVCRGIAGEIGRIAERHDPPVAAIDEQWASALSNATVREPSASVCREIAGEIGRIAERHDPPVAAIDERWASALSNATVEEPSASVCREIAGEIGRIAQRHDTPVAAIDERWASALSNATAKEPSASVCREIAGEIGRIAQRHDTPVAAIDEAWASALSNATAKEPSASVCREIAGEIGRIAQRHDTPVAAIDEAWAKALYNATVEEPSASVRREIAGEIGRIAERHHAPVAAIDEQWAKALFNATVTESSASVRREIAGEIGRIAERHHAPVATIDEQWAKAVIMMLAVSDGDVSFELPWHDTLFRTRVAPRILALLETVLADPEGALIIERLQKILEESDWAES